LTRDEYFIPSGAIRVEPVEYWAALGNVNQTLTAILNGNDVNATSSGGHTALHAAASNGHIDVIELLLMHDANPSMRLESGETPADLARLAGFIDIADRLASL
jgi:ankyrin repeat protein